MASSASLKYSTTVEMTKDAPSDIGQARYTISTRVAKICGSRSSSAPRSSISCCALTLPPP